MSPESEFQLKKSSENLNCGHSLGSLATVIDSSQQEIKQTKENFTTQNQNSLKKAAGLKQITFEGVTIMDTITF